MGFNLVLAFFHGIILNVCSKILHLLRPPPFIVLLFGHHIVYPNISHNERRKENASLFDCFIYRLLVQPAVQEEQVVIGHRN